MKSILLVKKLLGLVEMTSGLLNGSFSWPKWQAVKMIFFAPCYKTVINPLSTNIHIYFLTKFIEIEFDKRLKHAFSFGDHFTILIPFSLDDILILLRQN